MQIQGKRKIYIICPVREATSQIKLILDDYVQKLESENHNVHYPPRDVKQDDDPSGLRIMKEHRMAMRCADEVHVWWTPKTLDSNFSEGSRVDFGMTFYAEKPIRLINYSLLERTAGKSYTNVLLDLHEKFMNQTIDLH